MKQIIKAIERDEIFGIVECDIHVPLQWMKKTQIQHIHLLIILKKCLLFFVQVRCLFLQLVIIWKRNGTF